MPDVLDVAKYIVSKYWQNGSTITNLKLQKILYYIQGYSFKRCNSSAFSEAIYRWPYGPVVPEVYFSYNHFRSHPIPEPSDDDQLIVLSNIKKDPVTLKVIDEIIKKSFFFSAAQLVEKTHSEDPWLNTKDSQVIPTSLISMFFSNHDPLGLEEAL